MVISFDQRLSLRKVYRLESAGENGRTDHFAEHSTDHVRDITAASPRYVCGEREALQGMGANARAIASNFWNWLYRLRYNKPAFKTLLCKCALQAA